MARLTLERVREVSTLGLERRDALEVLGVGESTVRQLCDRASEPLPWVRHPELSNAHSRERAMVSPERAQERTRQLHALLCDLTGSEAAEIGLLRGRIPGE